MMFELPRLFASTSFTPAISKTARTPPPAIMPVPGAAGFIRICAALNFALTACGKVVPFIGTFTRFFRAM
ncbi:hypothetical protein D3C83_168450 [compost metagenome]